MLALSRLGYAILILSPRLSVEACVSLLEVTHSTTICYDLSLESTVSSIKRTRTRPRELKQMQLLDREDFMNTSMTSARMNPLTRESPAKKNVAFIMHSSGSTGMPKPIFQTHEACIQNYSAGHGLRSFLTVPLYHTHGHACLYRAIFERSTIHLLNARLSVTSPNLIAIMETVKPEIIFTVPYVLKILAESPRGIELMEKCKTVSCTGSQIPDNLGDRLVAHGIHLISHWGTYVERDPSQNLTAIMKSVHFLVC